MNMIEITKKKRTKYDTSEQKKKISSENTLQQKDTMKTTHFWENVKKKQILKFLAFLSNDFKSQ